MQENLEKYNQKRNFEKTLEPEGKTSSVGEELRFVVQHHIATRDHFDFRLEWQGALLSWAVPKGPSYDTTEKRLAIRVEDHPFEYRNFEGIIPKGEYGGGTVMLWDEGEWEPISDVKEALAKGALKFVLKGKRLVGKWALIRLETKEDGKENWILLKEKDEYANNPVDISEFATSIRTGRSMQEIEKGDEKNLKKNPFSNCDAKLAKLAVKVPTENGWIFEPKYDGYRIIAFVEENQARLMSRNENDYTKHFKEIANSLIALASGRAMVLDGEMAIIGKEGNTDFQALQNYMKNSTKAKLTYIIFDLIAFEGEDLRSYKLIDRKQKLKELLNGSQTNLLYSQHIEGKGEDCFLAACNAGMEGIIGKKFDSIYNGTRNSDWLKIKCDNRQEFVVAGYTLSDKKTSGLSSIILGVYEEERLVYAGRAGTGFTESMMKDLEQKFSSFIIKECPFDKIPKIKSNEAIIWLKPELVAEIKFAEWTKENLLRQASFKGLRRDKKATEVKREKAEEIEMKVDNEENKLETELKEKGSVKEVKITNPDRVIYDDPKITKGDVVLYYEKVAKRMLPYVASRILSIVRCPKGAMADCFFKKHPGPGSKGITPIPISNSKNEKDDYFYVKDAIGLISEAQMGAIEFHIWGSQVGELEKPDMMVFDLDPDEGMELATVRQGVKDLKSILDELSLVSYLKTSGGKGYHIVVPFKPSVSWDTFYDFSKRIAQVMETKWTDRYTSNMRKVSRKNKIFIDWVRNGRGSTSVAPYSLRARKGAGVSMPISWEELFTIAPDGINMLESLARIEQNDPWKDFFSHNQQLQ